MLIQQFEDKPLAHYSYAIISRGKMALVDPARNPMPYYQYAEKNKAKIVAVLETHPHADFASGHLQIHKETGATIYVSKLVGADYPHHTFDEGDALQLGEISFKAINTPGHSPDSITIIATDESGKSVMFSGDTLFIGDVGRPDLREKAGNMQAKREKMARSMYNTTQTKFTHLPDNTIIYPAHGAGSLCGKNMSSDSSSTLGKERSENWALQKQSEEEFIKEILQDQPFIPAYFKHDVKVNNIGANNYLESMGKVDLQVAVTSLKDDKLIIDVRNEQDYKKNHFQGSINIMARNEDDKFETWLGSLVKPDEKFYLVVDSVEDKTRIVDRAAKIAYESQIIAVCTMDVEHFEKTNILDLDQFKKDTSQYTVIDIRNENEVEEEKYFKNAINIPLNELRDSNEDIPENKPIVVHCAGGYRSAAGSSIIENMTDDVEVYDLSEHINEFKK